MSHTAHIPKQYYVNRYRRLETERQKPRNVRPVVPELDIFPERLLTDLLWASDVHLCSSQLHAAIFLAPRTARPAAGPSPAAIALPQRTPEIGLHGVAPRDINHAPGVFGRPRGPKIWNHEKQRKLGLSESRGKRVAVDKHRKGCLLASNVKNKSIKSIMN